MFDYLVTGGVLPFNPAAAVRGPRLVVKKGKTPVLKPEEARALLDSIDTGTLSGVRDRALIGVMVYSFARVGAVVSMDVRDYYQQGKRWWLRLREKGGKRHEVPAHHNAEAYLDAYLYAANLWEQKKTPLFRSIDRRRRLTENAMHWLDVLRMVKRRVKHARLGAGHQLPHLPRHRHHRVPVERRHHRERPGDRGARVAAHHQALRPDLR